MHINITARHLKLTDGLADYVNRKVGRLQRYLNTLVNAQVKLDVAKYRQTTEIILHSGGNIFKAAKTGPDMYSTIDQVIDKLENQLRRHKEKTRKRHLPSARTLAAGGVKEAKRLKFLQEIPEDIYEFYRENVKSLLPSQAVGIFRTSARKFMLFLNTDTGRINLIYEKENGNPAVVEPVY